MRIQKAFTLVELLVVIAIIGILAAAVIFGVSSARDKAAAARAMNDCSNYVTAQSATFAESEVYVDEPDAPPDYVCGPVGNYLSALSAPAGWSYNCIAGTTALVSFRACKGTTPVACTAALAAGAGNVDGSKTGCVQH